MSNPTYSQIIAPRLYNRLMQQHVHIPEADRHIVDLVKWNVRRGQSSVLEIGCGPARLLRKLDKIDGVNLVGVDHETSFVEVGREIISRQRGNTEIVCSDIAKYHPGQAYSLVVSQGMHHHIPKCDVPAYLDKVRQLLLPSGYYIVGDEFLAQYNDETERQVIAVMWYSHVIASAIRKEHQQLAVEEAKTLLDDLAMGGENIKSSEQLDLVLTRVKAIESSIEDADLNSSRILAKNLLAEVKSHSPDQATGDDRLDLSRGDFKVSGAVFRDEVTRAGFRVIDTRWFGPIDVAGAMGVFTLQMT